VALLHRALIVAVAGCSGPEAPSEAPEPSPTGDPADAGLGAPLDGRVGQPLALASEGASGERFTWTLPDGTELQGPSVEATFDAPGHDTVYLEVEGALGDVAVASIALTVTWPVVEGAGAGAQPLAERDGTLFVAMPDHDRVAEVDVASRAVTTWHPVGDEPRSVAVVGDDVLVACAASDEVHVLGGGVVALPWGSRPMAIVSLGDTALVALQGSGQLAEIDEGGVLRTVDALPDVRGLAVTADRVLASRHRSPDDGGQVWVAGLDLADPEVLVLERDPGPDSDTNARGVPSYLQRIAIRPDARTAVVGGLKANLERGLFVEGRELTFDTTLRSDLRQLPLVPGEAEGAAIFDDRDQVSAIAYSRRGDWLFVAHLGMETVDVLDSYTLGLAGAIQGVGHAPDALWLTQDDRELWVLASLSRELAIYDLSDGVGAPLPVGRVDLQPPSGEPLAPEVLQGKVIFHRSADTRMAAQGYLACSSCHLDGDADGRTWDFTQRGEGLRNTIPLFGRAGAGHGPIHWSANFDEVQDFENDIRGGQGGHGFLSEDDWAATSDTLGAPKAGLSPELDALAAYLESLVDVPRSPFREADGALTPDAALGQQLFEDPVVGCATCHPAPEYTDSAWVAPGVPLLHDVGTFGTGSGQRLGGALDGLDTPTLRGVWESAPYLHDGSAATLREVLVDRNPADAHGVTSHLTPAELDALVAFLRQLE
jgi:hypothetical protein